MVDSDTFASKGKNTPLVGSVLKGKVIATIAQGRLVYRDDALDPRENRVAGKA